MYSVLCTMMIFFVVIEIQLMQLKLQNLIYRPESESVQGIVFIIRMFGPNETALDVQNVQSTFKKLNFAAYVQCDPTAHQIVDLVKAATMCRYTSRYKYICFYFTGHGGRNKNGQLFIKDIQINGYNSVILNIEEYIIMPLRSLDSLIRLFFFDCYDKTSGNDSPNHPKVVSGELIVFSSSEKQSSFGIRTNEGNFTNYLCKNLQKNLPLTEVLAITSYQIKHKQIHQEPLLTILNKDEFERIILYTGES